MIKEFLFGSTIAMCVAGQVSALTITVLEDNRFIEAEASAGGDSEFNNDFPDPAFSLFTTEVTSSAMEFDFIGDTESVVDNYGASSFGAARQSSKFSGNVILFKGAAFAQGGHGDDSDHAESLAQSSNSIQVGGPGSFNAYGDSVLDILFSIDEVAAYDLIAFISAGTELALGAAGNDVFNLAEMILFNEGTAEAVFDFEVSDDEMEVNESGVIGPGTYRFTVSAYAEVFGEGLEEVDSAGGTGQLLQFDGYETTASYGGKGFALTAIDQPIPEPVTTSLIGLSLGALALYTSRRRRA